MLTISQDQFDALHAMRRRDFLRGSLAFLRRERPLWATGRSDEEIEAFLERTVAFADDHGIAARGQRRRLMLLHVDHGFEPDAYLSMLLRREGVSEAGRMKDYAAALTRPNRPRRITLDDL